MENFSGTMQAMHAHGKRVGALAGSFAQKLQMNSVEQFELFVAGRWHDFGKMALNLDILNKPSKLSSIEFEEIKNHPVYSAILLQEAGFSDSIVEMILHHHEDWSGGGYPSGLVGFQIPIGACVIRVCDVFDALTEQRLYKNTIPAEEAIKIMVEEAELGKYHPGLFRMFKDCYKELVSDVEIVASTISSNMHNLTRGSVLLREDGERGGSA